MVIEKSKFYVFRFKYPNRFNPSMIKPMPNNEPVDILCHHSVGNKNMKSGKS